MGKAAHDDEQSQNDRASTWTIPSIVPTSTSPCWEACLEKEIVSFPLWASQDIGNGRKPLESPVCFLVESIHLALAWLLVNFGSLFALLWSPVVCNEGLLGLVWVDARSLFPVRFCDLFVRRARLDADEGVECRVRSFALLQLILELEELVICVRSASCAHVKGIAV